MARARRPEGGAGTPAWTHESAKHPPTSLPIEVVQPDRDGTGLKRITACKCGGFEQESRGGPGTVLADSGNDVLFCNNRLQSAIKILLDEVHDFAARPGAVDPRPEIRASRKPARVSAHVFPEQSRRVDITAKLGQQL